MLVFLGQHLPAELGSLLPSFFLLPLVVVVVLLLLWLSLVGMQACGGIHASIRWKVGGHKHCMGKFLRWLLQGCFPKET